MIDTLVRHNFANKTEAKTAERTQECFSETERVPVGPPNGTDLEGRATSKSEIQQYLDTRKVERKRAYRRKYMRKYRKHHKKALKVRAAASKPYAGLTSGDWEAIQRAETGYEELAQAESHA